MHAPDFSGRSSLLPGQSSEPHAQTGLARQLARYGRGAGPEGERDQSAGGEEVLREAGGAQGPGHERAVCQHVCTQENYTTFGMFRASNIDCQCYGFDARL